VWEVVKGKADKAKMVETEQKKEMMQRKKKKDFRKPTIKKEIEIARMIEEKQKKEKDLIKIRMVEEMVPRRFYKYLKMFKRKKLERMPMRKTWNYAIDLRKGFVPKKEKIYPLLRIEREEVHEFVKNKLRKRYIVICKSTHLETTSPWWSHLQNIQAHLPQWPPFSQYILEQCCKPLGIPSSKAEILLFNSVFHDRVTPVSVSTLKPLLGIIGVVLLKPQVSPILSVCI